MYILDGIYGKFFFWGLGRGDENKNQHKYEIIKLDNKNKERHILLISNKKVE